METAVQAYGRDSKGYSLYAASAKKSELQADALVLNASLNAENENAAVISTDFSDLYKGLSITAREIVDKLNEMLKESLPDGLQSLKPEDVTPEATADRIVQGSTAFFEAFKKQNPELEGEDLLNAFMQQVRSGVKQGYGSAAETLEGLGAFEFDGVKEGIEKTMELVETKLQAFEEMKRKEMALEAPVADQAQSELLKQAGSGVMH